MTPRYVKCVKEWSGKSSSVVGKIYDTTIPPDFSVHDWDYVLNYNPKYFLPVEDTVIETYELY